MSGTNSILGLSEPKKEILDIYILMSIQNFMCNSAEHEISFITSGPGHVLLFKQREEWMHLRKPRPLRLLCSLRT